MKVFTRGYDPSAVVLKKIEGGKGKKKWKGMVAQVKSPEPIRPPSPYLHPSDRPKPSGATSDPPEDSPSDPPAESLSGHPEASPDSPADDPWKIIR